MCIGQRCDVICAPLILGDSEIQYIQGMKYMGVQTVDSKQFEWCVKNVRMKYHIVYHVFHKQLKQCHYLEAQWKLWMIM